MKTNLLLITVLLFAISCAKEPSAENNQSGADVEYTSMTFKATAEDVTKVLLQNDRVSLHWQASDRIKVFDGVSNDLPAFVPSGSGAQVDFYGQVVNSEGPFYALYPYQEGATFALDAANDNAPTIYAEIPEIQHAVAGSVPSNAFVAAAISSPDGTLRFKSMIDYIRFTLNDERAADIESITLSGNDGESLSGPIKITFDNNGNPVDTYTGVMLRTVTLVGNFINGEDYIFAVREQAFWKGLTLSILYKNGTRRYISSDYRPVDGSGAHIPMTPNLVMNIGAINSSEMKTATPPDRYVAYLHGYNLEIAGETYNLAKNGPPTLIKAPEGGSVGISAQIKGRQSGVFFLDSSLGECKLETHTVVAGDHVALVGRYSDQTKTNAFTPRAYLELRGGKFVMYDLDIDLQNVKYSDGTRINYFLISGNTVGSDVTQGRHIDAIVIDSCKVRNMWTKLIVQHKDNTTFTFKKIKIINSDIEIDENNSANVIHIVDLAGKSVQCWIEEFVFDNNIVFHRFEEQGAIQLTCRVFDVGVNEGEVDESFANQTWNTDISFCNNTMLNVPTPAGYVRAYKVKNVKINKNICAVQDGYDGYSGYLIYLYNWNQSTDNVDIAKDGNLFYGLVNAGPNKRNWNYANSSSAWHPKNTLTPPWENNNPPRSEYPFQTINFDTFTFTPLAKYADYGAQR